MAIVPNVAVFKVTETHWIRWFTERKNIEFTRYTGNGGKRGAHQPVQLCLLTVGTDTFPVGFIPYVVPRPHSAPSSIHMAVEGGYWWHSLAAEEPMVAMPDQAIDTTIDHIAEGLRHLSPDQLTERTPGEDHGVIQPLMTSSGEIL